MPLVKGVVCTDNPEVGFKDVDAAFMVGAMPRREGMERKDLLAANVKIFKVLRTEVRGDFNIHGTKFFYDAVFHQKSKNYIYRIIMKNRIGPLNSSL